MTQQRNSQPRFEAAFLDSQEDLALLFCTEVLKLRSLHWGFWDVGEEDIVLKDLPQAQLRFSNEIFTHIPDAVNSVLDIGCGVGDNAQLLAERGFTVTAISPDINQQRIVDGMDGVSFHRSGIEEFDSSTRFDLALMSESSHFFPMETGFRKCRQLLRPGGYLLAACMMRRSDSKEFGNFHIEEAWLASAREHGFDVQEQRDITPNVLPSSVLIRSMYRDYLLPLMDIGEKLVRRESLPRRLLLNFLLGGQLSKIRQYLSDGFISQVSDPDLFVEKAKYGIYLLRAREK